MYSIRRTDENQKQIIASLRKVIGAKNVIDTHELGNGFPDIVCGYAGKNFMFEIKKDKKSKLTDDEKTFVMNWRGQYSVITTPLEALICMGFI